MISPLTFEVLYPAKMFIKVLLPAPEGPMMAVNSPGRIVPLTPIKIKEIKALVLEFLNQISRPVF